MTDIRDRVRDIEQTDRFCHAGRAIAYRPEAEDEPEMAGMLVRAAVSDSGHLIDDADNVEGLAERARDMMSQILDNGAGVQEHYADDGVHLRMTKKEIFISIPDAPYALDGEAILKMAEEAIARAEDDLSVAI